MTRPVLALLVSLAPSTAPLALSATPLAAQPSRVRLTAGARVRGATPPRVGWVVGTLVLADSERVVLRGRPPAAADTFPVAALQALEVSRGRPWVARSVVGALIVGVVWGAAGAALGKYGGQGEDTEDLLTAAGAVAGFAGGALVGGTIGALTAHERWDSAVLR